MNIAPRWEILIEGKDVSKDISADVTSVSFEDHATDADMATLIMANPGNKWTDSPLLELGNMLELSLGYGHSLVKVFKGPIIRPELSFPEDGVPTMTVRAYDQSSSLRKKPEKQVTTWKNVTDSQIARAVAARHGFKPTELDIEDTKMVIEYVAQGNETDWEFLKRRAERTGFEVYVERDTFHFHSPKDAVAKLADVLEYRRNLRSFEPRLSVQDQVTKVVVRGWDAERKSPIIAIATGKDTVRTVLGEKAGSEFVKDFGDNVKVLYDLVPRTVKEAEELARAYLKKKEYTLIEATGSCVGDPSLQAKRLIEIAGVGKRYSGNYYVTKVTHTLDDSGYICEFECSKNAVD